MLQNRLLQRFDAAYRTLSEAVKHHYNLHITPLGKALQQAIDQRAADIQKRWEESEYDAENPIHRLRGQSLIWLFSMARRLRRRDVPLRAYYLPAGLAVGSLLLATIVSGAAIEILLAAVLISMRTGGLRSGLLTTLICFVGIAIAMRPALHTATGGAVVAALLGFVVVSIIVCILIDSLEMARQDCDARRIAAESVAKRFRFLAEATAMLESEYTYEGILTSVTRAIVPACAQWATADIFRDGQLRRMALSHQDESICALLRSAQRSRTLSIPPDHSLYEALHTRQARVFADVTGETLAPLRLDGQDAAGLKPEHILFIPITARNRLLGALTLISTVHDAPFSATDLFVMRDLALRVGAAMDNLQLYYGALDEAAENARREREAADQKVLLERQRTELVAINERLAVEAKTDGLTGLLNHLTFRRCLDQEFLRAQRTGSALSLAILDVDRFKTYNDTFGHPAGDEVLKRLSEIMQETTRNSDLVARYGGEEFVVVMPYTDIRGAMETMERLRHAVEMSPWPNCPITASFGIATFTRDMQVPRDLVAAADEALYRSKQEGRNRITHSGERIEAVVVNSGLVGTAGLSR